jgi:short-subunit dehydrogenase
VDWTNKVIWITGASSGIGEELVYQLAEKGARIILSARNTDKLEAIKQQAGLDHTTGHIYPLDVSDYHDLATAAQNMIDRFGRIDVLINNAGVTQRAVAADTLISVDERLMNTNYFGAIALTKALLPHFLERQSGIIAVTSSVAGKIGTPLRTAYCASKHALYGFYESLRAEVYQHGIQVTLVCPGFINTDISRNALKGDGSKYGISDEAQAKGVPVKRCVKLYIKALEDGKEEVIIAGMKEKSGILLSRFIPGLLRRMMRRVKVT